MPIQVRLFGDLKQRGDRMDESDSVGLIDIDDPDVTTIADVLSYLDLGEEEVSHTFLNFEYSDLDTRVKEGDRLSIFPRSMALLYRWYFRGGMKRSYASGQTRK
jgi:molybdopterin converting factor small subunit